MGRRCRCGSNVGVGLLCGSAMTMTTMKMVGLEFGLTWIMKVLGLVVGVGEGVEALGLSGFVVEVVVLVGHPIWCWWAMGCGSRFWVSGIIGRGWLRQRCGF